jgi:hypothetical protein
MSWNSGPFDDHQILWFGLQAFSWRRIAGVMQMGLGLAVLATFLTNQHKIRLHGWFVETARESVGVYVPPVISIWTVLKWAILVVLCGAAAAAAFVPVRTAGGQAIPGWAVFIIATILLGALSFPFTGMLVFGSLLVTSFKMGQRYTPGLLAWVFHHKRFDRSVTVISLLLFLIVSAFQLYLS